MGRRRFLVLMLAVAGAVAGGCATPQAGFPGFSAVAHPGEVAGAVTIYRDRYGVPHVFGPTDASVVFGVTYARAEDEFYRMEESVISALRRSAEVPGEAALPHGYRVAGVRTKNR